MGACVTKTTTSTPVENTTAPTRQQETVASQNPTPSSHGSTFVSLSSSEALKTEYSSMSTNTPGCFDSCGLPLNKGQSQQYKNTTMLPGATRVDTGTFTFTTSESHPTFSPNEPTPVVNTVSWPLGKSPRSRIVIIGGGFGGAAVAKALEKMYMKMDVVLIDTKDYFENTSAIFKSFTDPICMKFVRNSFLSSQPHPLGYSKCDILLTWNTQNSFLEK